VARPQMVRCSSAAECLLLYALASTASAPAQPRPLTSEAAPAASWPT
jgi:hypothetical protein